MSTLPTEPERSNFRDEGISKRHREWGVDCRAADIDFLLIEYDNATVAALIEYKNEYAAPQYLTGARSSNIRALIDLGNRAKCPVFIVRYATNYTWFKVGAVNPHADVFLPNRAIMSEAEYVAFLYLLRNKKCPQSVLAKLNKVIIK